MVDINDYREERSCVHKGENYLVRDNGAVLRKPRPNQRLRKNDNEWTFGKVNSKTGYLEIASVRVHRIVALAFHGEAPTKEHVVDHIDTNRQNNRPDNLRWVTRLENAVLNEATRQKIEYRTGVSIYEFLENPAKYRDSIPDSDFGWMRQVTEAEAKACLENVRKWSGSKNESSKHENKLGDWIYQSQRPNLYSRGVSVEGAQSRGFDPEEEEDITDSLTAMAKQKNWRTPTEFPCCPSDVDGNPIMCYLKNLSEDAVFSENRLGKFTIKKYVDCNNAIFVITATPSGIKPFALAKITFEKGYFLHTSLGSFFAEDEANKQFTLAQGLEWTGEDSIDDYT